MKVYIAGPMTGFASYNFPAFDGAAKYLRGCGYAVINPAELDRDTGFDPEHDAAGTAFLRGALRRDLSAICECDGVAVLPGWQQSLGACIEVALAVRLGLRIIDAETTEDLTDDTSEYMRWRILA